MGEYVKLQDRVVKLGTCEDLYYVRFSQLQENVMQMTPVEGNDKPDGYLDPNNGYRYRFPFPDEDHLKLGSYERYNRGLLVGVPYHLLEGVEHAGIMKGLDCQGGYNVNVICQCPADPGFVPTCSQRTDRVPVEIVQQKQVEGSLWTVCRCGWCGNKFRMPKDQAEQFCQAILELNHDDYWQEVTRRILIGYATKTEQV